MSIRYFLSGQSYDRNGATLLASRCREKIRKKYLLERRQFLNLILTPMATTVIEAKETKSSDEVPSAMRRLVMKYSLPLLDGKEVNVCTNSVRFAYGVSHEAIVQAREAIKEVHSMWSIADN